MRKDGLERALETIPPFTHAQPELEQYRTPPGIAARLLTLASDDGAIADRNVLDLGCGTGMLTIGAAVLGARLATGVDVAADALELARHAAQRLGVEQRTWFIAADITAWHADPDTFDTVVMNPPFGAQAGNRHGDRVFYERACAAVAGRAGTVWFLARETTEAFLAKTAAANGMRAEKVGSWDYPLEATMAHHREDVRTVRVGAYRIGPG